MIYANNNISSKNKSFEIIKELNAIGLFEFTVTNKIVSTSLGISSNTAYKHLRPLSNKNIQKIACDADNNSPVNPGHR